MGSNAASSGGSKDHRTQKGFEAPPKKKNKVVEFIKGGGITGAVIRGVVNAFDTKKNKKSKSGDVYAYDEAKEKIDYKPSLLFNRYSGNNNVNAAVPLTANTTSAAIIAPTTAEVSQSAATDVASIEPIDNILLKKKKTKATGRSMTILTSSKGVKSDEGLTLGKKSLLGS
tara:strand:- start:41 stop:553 length:513 start_codon:yes stop_codon:yes gene_type:complete